MPDPFNEDSFIPCTLERAIAKDIVFRPRRSWHSATYAGEGLKEVRGDRSGCMDEIQDKWGPREVCNPPRTVTHRTYWNKKTQKSISAFLSYPNGMGIRNEYFWEIYPFQKDIKRFFGPEAEKEMEKTIKRMLKTPSLRLGKQ